MKKILLFFQLLFIPGMYLSAQTANDESSILQICIDLPELQDYYKGDQLYVMYHGISLSTQVEVFHKRTKVEFYDKLGITSLGVSDFFLFWQFYIEDSNAKVVGQYILNSGAETEKSIPFELNFSKESGSWVITDQQIKLK